MALSRHPLGSATSVAWNVTGRRSSRPVVVLSNS